VTTQTPAIVTPHPRRGGPGRRLLLGLAAAAVAALAGAGLWQATRDGGTETATPPAVAVEQPVVARPLESAPTYYLVRTAVQADAMRAELQASGAMVTANPGDTVLLIASAEDEAALRMLVEQDAIRAELGLPPVRFVDLRAPVATATPVDSLARELDALTAANAAPALTDGAGRYVIEPRARSASASPSDVLARQLEAVTAEGLGVPVAP